MAIAVTLVDETNTGTATDTATLNIATPSMVAGDVSILAFVGLSSTPTLSAPPTNYTLVTEVPTLGATSNTVLQVYRRYATGNVSAGTASFTFSGGTSKRAAALSIKVTGADTSTPIQTSAATSSTTLAAPALTADATTDFLMTFHAGRGPAGDATAFDLTGPSGMTLIGEEYTTASASSQVGVHADYLQLSATGSTGAKTATVTTGSAPGQGAISLLFNTASAVSQTAAGALSVTAAGASSTESPTKFHFLKDDFATDKLATLWPASAGVTVSGGTANIATSTVLGDNALRTNYAWSLKGSYVQAEIEAPLAAGSTSAVARMLVRPNTSERLEMRADNAVGTLYLEHRDATGSLVTAPTDTGAVSVPRVLPDMRCMQIAENGGFVYFQTSPDGVTWTTRRRIVTPSWVTDTPNLRLDITAYKNAGTADDVNVDNVNLLTEAAPPPPPPVVEPDPVPTPGGGGPATGFIKTVQDLGASHYYPMNSTYGTRDCIGKGAAGRNDLSNAGGVTFGTDAYGTDGAIFDGGTTDYLTAPGTPDFSAGVTGTGGNGSSTGVVSYLVCVTFPTYTQPSQFHWMSVGGDQEGPGKQEGNFEWAMRLYGGTGGSGRARGVSAYYWNPNPSWDIDGVAVPDRRGSGAYLAPPTASPDFGGGERQNGPVHSGEIGVEHIFGITFTYAGTNGYSGLCRLWYGDEFNNMVLESDRRMNSDAKITPRNRLGRLFIGKRGDDDGMVKATIRKVAIFNKELTTANWQTLRDAIVAGNAEGTPEGSGGTPTAPSVIRNLVMSHTQSSVTGSWSPPATAGTAAISHYDVTLTATGQPTQTKTIVNNQADLAGSRTATFTGLATGVTYTYSVKARNSVGPSAAVTANESTGTTVPGSPTALTVTPGNTQLTVGWTPPIDTGGSGITGYDLTYTPSGGSPTTISDITTTSRVVTGLTNGVLYSLSVVAKNANGSSVTPLTGLGTPSAGATAPNPISAVTAVAGDGRVTASWSAPPDGGSTILDYTATLSTGAVQTVATGPVSFTGLTNGTAYSVSVTARNAIGSSTPTASATVTPFSLPSGPTSLALTAGDKQIAAAWGLPTNQGTGGVTGYRVTASLANGTVVATVNATGRSTTLTGLTNGTTYTVRVYSVTAYGESAVPAQSTATPFAVAVTVPSEPLDFEATPGTSGAVNLVWSAPNRDGGAAVSGYNLTVRQTSTGALVFSDAYNETEFSDTISGLVNGTQYTFSLSAFNSAGSGLAATAQATPLAPEGPPGQVEGLTAVATGATTVLLSWGAPITGSAVTSYVLTANPSIGTITINPSAHERTITGLEPETEYVFTLIPVNLFGSGISDTATVTTQPAPIPEVTQLPVPNMYAFPQPGPGDVPRVFRPANFGKTIKEVPAGD